MSEAPGVVGIFWGQCGKGGIGWILSVCELSTGSLFGIEGKGQETSGGVDGQKGPG